MKEKNLLKIAVIAVLLVCVFASVVNAYSFLQKSRHIVEIEKYI